jgi:phosphoserine phosphatase
MTTVAVIFDFDDTLMPDSTTALLEAKGIDAKTFWSKTVKGFVDQGYDTSLAWLNPFIDLVGDGKPLGKLTLADLEAFGATLGPEFYPGLSTLLPALRKLGIEVGVPVEFYVISGGLQELIDATPLVRKFFRAVYASQLGVDAAGLIRRIKRSINFTEKTRFLFEINKGIRPEQTRTKPYLVNLDVPEVKRPVPFRHMIYVGDGLTDIPCFSLVKKLGGSTFGVFDPQKEGSAKRALQEFLKTDRVLSVHKPRYRKTDELGSLLRTAVAAACSRVKLEQQEATPFA